MQFVRPMPFREAIEKLGTQWTVSSGLNTEQWREVPLALRDSAFFSATIENARFLQSAKDFLFEFLSGNREILDNRELPLAAGSRAQFVKELSDFAVANGLGPLDPEDKGTLKDITSQARLSLIFNTKTQQAHDYGYWKQGQDPDVLDAFPAQQFIREAEVTTPRPVHQENEGVIRLKSDLSFWLAMNSPDIGGFGVPWGPWGFNSGMGVEDVDRATAEQLGLLAPGEAVQPVDKEFNDKLQASAAGLDDDVLEKLKEQFGDQIAIEGDTIRWRDTASQTANPKPEPTLAPAEPAVPSEPTKPVSDAIENTISNRAHRERVNDALRAIDSVHDDGVLPKIRLDGRSGELGEYSLRDGRIGVKRSGAWPELTTAHEVGHFIDHHALGSGGTILRTLASEASDARLAEWWDAVRASDAYAQLQRGASALGRTYNYLLTRRELFARSYAQYIAEKSGHATMLQQLETVRGVSPGRQWTTEDFAPIRAALDKLFTSLGWL